MNTWYSEIESPCGRLRLAAGDSGLRRITFLDGARGPQPAPPPSWVEDPRRLDGVIRQLRAYFAGHLRDFDVPLAAEGTGFQREVWRLLRGIPYGETISYGELARRAGNPKASRAVGAANGANPIPIIVPCHRVIGSNGRLTGFGGGLPIKERLLDLERASRMADPGPAPLPLFRIPAF